MPKDKLLNFAWQIGVALVLIAMGWSALQGNVAELHRNKLDTERFVVDSINTARDLKEIRAGVENANEQLREIKQLLARRQR